MQDEISVIAPCVASLPLSFSLNHNTRCIVQEESGLANMSCAIVHTLSTHKLMSFDGPVIWW